MKDQTYNGRPDRVSRAFAVRSSAASTQGVGIQRKTWTLVNLVEEQEYWRRTASGGSSGSLRSELRSLSIGPWSIQENAPSVMLPQGPIASARASVKRWH